MMHKYKIPAHTLVKSTLFSNMMGKGGPRYTIPVYVGRFPGEYTKHKVQILCEIA